MKDEDAIEIPEDDFRRIRRYFAPWLFASEADDRTLTWPPPNDLVSREAWEGVVDLPTDVALKSSSYEGRLIQRLHDLHSNWIFSWPEVGGAPFMEEVVLLAGEEFDALVFNALHGWYRQALGCLRNALETLTIAAGLAVRSDQAKFDEWRAGTREIKFGNARDYLGDSAVGLRIEADASPESVFGLGATAWCNALYDRLCAYAHSEAGFNDIDFWEGSNGPIFVPSALTVVERDLRETLAISYLLVRLGWPGYKVGPGQRDLLSGLRTGWEQYGGLLEKWLV